MVSALLQLRWWVAGLMGGTSSSWEPKDPPHPSELHFIILLRDHITLSHVVCIILYKLSAGNRFLFVSTRRLFDMI